MIDEIMPHIYGASAPFMRRYFDMHHAFIKECVANPGKAKTWREPNTVLFRRQPLEYAKKALGVLEKAKKAAGDDEYMLMKINTEKYHVLYAYINEFMAIHPDIPEDQFEGYALKLVELVKLARKYRVPSLSYRNRPSFSEWLYQTTGVLDFDRGPYTWFNDKKIDLFLTNPVKTLKKRVYFQEKITNGWELPAKALFGGQHLENYSGCPLNSVVERHPGAVIRRNSSSVPRIRAYWRLDTLPDREAELHVQGFDNEKKEKAEISIKINNHEIFAGPVNFPKNKWGKQTYKVPLEYLKQGENIIVIENITKDYKTEITGQAGPAEEALAQNYNWGWCMVGTLRLTGWSHKAGSGGGTD